jgi:hypothetical protein
MIAQKVLCCVHPESEFVLRREITADKKIKPFSDFHLEPPEMTMRIFHPFAVEG